MSLSNNKRKVFCNSWLGQRYATLLIHCSSSSPNNQRWVISLTLTQKSDWMMNLCDKQSVKYPKNGPVFGLSCEHKKLSSLTTEYNQGPDASSSSGQWKQNQGTSQGKFRVHSEFLTDLDKVPRPEMVEVFWNFVTCNLSFFQPNWAIPEKGDYHHWGDCQQLGPRIFCSAGEGKYQQKLRTMEMLLWEALPL